jgi:ubiquinone/menaquinone biosynthesis C-methylase UbiE
MRSSEPVVTNETSRVSLANPILQEWRKRIYAHVQSFLKPGSYLLELNAGTGIDALYFAGQGNRVHATDLSPGMVQEMEKKIFALGISGISCQQVSFQHLDEVTQGDFDYVFSNFGGLNCIQDLSLVTRHLSKKLKPGGYVTWVIMPTFCPWELSWLLRGKWRQAGRRFQKGGTRAHVEGEYFQTYYHSLADVQRALGRSFELVRSEGLGVFAPPPAAIRFYTNHPFLTRLLKRVDKALKDHFPFHRWGDHIIVTFRRI